MSRAATLAALAALALALAAPAPAPALDDGLARTPPLGWSSWNRFFCDVDERTVREVADALVATGMRRLGYTYVNVDDCWMALARDAAGALRADPFRFPSGIPALARYLRARGLRLGLYTSIGRRTCAGRPGLAGHERQDLRLMLAWGADFLKLDYCSVSAAVRRRPWRAYARLRQLVRARRRPVVLSVVNWGERRPWRWAARSGHMWRTGPDLAPRWRAVLRAADRAAPLWRHAGPGGWNDPDMLQVGNRGLSAVESRAHMSLWALLAAPLIAGNDPRAMDAATRTTLLNRELIAVDQDRRGLQGRRLRRLEGGREVWARRLSGAAVAVLLLNRGRRPATIAADLRRLGLVRARSIAVRDLWRHRGWRQGSTLRARVPGHGAALLRVRALPRAWRTAAHLPYSRLDFFRKRLER